MMSHIILYESDAINALSSFAVDVMHNNDMAVRDAIFAILDDDFVALCASLD